jgi:ATP-binding cassette subfamily B protein
MIEDPQAKPRMLTIESDLRRDGSFGPSRLIAEDGRICFEENGRRLEEWDTSELAGIEYEELVDAGRIVGRRKGATIELMRGTASVSSILSAGAKDLAAFIKGDPLVGGGPERRLCPKCHRPLPADSDVCDYCINRGQTLLRLFRFVKPYKWHVVLSTALLLAGTAMTLLPGLLIKILVDDVFGKGEHERFVPVIFMMIGASLALMVLTMLRGWINAWIGNRVTVDIRSRLFEQLQALSLSFF